MFHTEVDVLRNQLVVARTEINKLRQQVRNLQYVQRKDIDGVRRILKDFRCEGCRQKNTEENSNEGQTPSEFDEKCCTSANVPDGGPFRSIGVIRTDFPEKRAVPRQSSVANRLRGTIQLNNATFTNPEHALEGLADFSHLWLIYHFHKNSAHPKAKVAPPRLGGERVGVFSTRSPHRPCPIGLSLVEIERVDGSMISFYGTDMVDGTPVLDIKPYIPFYDVPLTAESGRLSVGPSESVDFYNSRQEPDGEESDLELSAGGASALTPTNDSDGGNAAFDIPPPGSVKVPDWIVARNRLRVCFNEHAEEQLLELDVQRQCIVDILEADPRSVYLRTKYGSQIFTFQLREVTVTCKFDDRAGMVTVVQVRRTENVQDDNITESC